MRLDTPWLTGALVALSVGHWLWRHYRAREIAEQWLRQHGYRVRSLRLSFLDIRPRFRMTPFRNNDWAVDFRADVDDTKLGGTGKVRLRVWTDWLGMIDREPEISWVQMPTEEHDGAKTPETEWASAQIAILRRVAAGEGTFRPAAKDPDVRREFDETVEHVLALQRRGLLTCSTPIAELKADAQYAAVGDIVLTNEGHRILSGADAEERAQHEDTPSQF
jgi:hypothetical protein